MTDDEREDAEALRWYVPAGVREYVERRAKEALSVESWAKPPEAFPDVKAGPDGITVTVSLNGHAPPDRATSGQNELARHRPTRFALIMRRRRANAARKQRGEMQKPAILAGDCATCEGLGVVDNDRRRCPSCNGSGER